MSKNSSGFIHILLILVVVIAIGLVLFLGKDKLKSIVQVGTPVPPAAVDPTANWKIYNITPDSSTGYDNYEVKVPSSWVQIEHSSFVQNMEVFQDKFGDFTYKLTIEEEKNNNNQTGKFYLNLRELTGLSYDVDTVLIDGQSGAKVLPRAGSESDYRVVFFSKNSKNFFTITLETPRDGSKTQEGVVLFDQILSTFKFTQ